MKKLLFLTSTAILLLPGCCCFKDVCDTCKPCRPCRVKKAAPTAAEIVEEPATVITEGEIVKVREELDLTAPKPTPVQKTNGVNGTNGKNGKKAPKAKIVEEEFDEILVK